MNAKPVFALGAVIALVAVLFVGFNTVSEETDESLNIGGSYRSPSTSLVGSYSVDYIYSKETLYIYTGGLVDLTFYETDDVVICGSVTVNPVTGSEVTVPYGGSVVVDGLTFEYVKKGYSDSHGNRYDCLHIHGHPTPSSSLTYLNVEYGYPDSGETFEEHLVIQECISTTLTTTVGRTLNLRYDGDISEYDVGRVTLIGGTMPSGVSITNKDDTGFNLTGSLSTRGTYCFTLEVEEYHDEGEAVSYERYVINVGGDPMPSSYQNEFWCVGYDNIPTYNRSVDPNTMFHDIIGCEECTGYATYSWDQVPAGVNVEALNTYGGWTVDVTGSFKDAGIYTLSVDCPESCGTTKIIYTAGAASYTHTITYDGNGATGGSTPDTVVTDTNNGHSLVTVAANGFTKAGYTFTGWKIGNGTYQPGATNLSVGPNEKVTAVAQWTKNTLTIGTVAKQYAVAGSPVSFSESCTSSPSGASVKYAASNVSSGLTVNINGNTVTCSASVAGTYTFTLTASATDYASSSTTVTVQFVPTLAFTNTPSAGGIAN